MTILPGWGREQLPRELVKHGCKTGAEIGVQSGEYSEKLLRAGIERLWLVDLWAQQKNRMDFTDAHDEHHQRNMRDMLRRIEQFPFRTHILIGMSHEVATHSPDQFLDFVYIDANHSLESIRLDLAAWAPKVRPGGIVSGHDFLNHSNLSVVGLRMAVTEFCESNGINELFVCRTEPTPNWHFYKP